MRWRRPAAVVLAAVAVAGAGIAGVQVHRTGRAAAIATEIDADSRPLVTECRWERGAPGGPPRDCNAAEEEHAAVVRLFSDAEPDMMRNAALLDALEQDRAPPANVAAFLASHGGALAALHQAALCSWACVRDVPHENWHRGSTLDAVEVLLASAAASPPPACFSQALDALRIQLDDQTGLPSALVYVAPGSRRLAHATRHTLLSCAARADAAALRSAASDAAAIAAAPPPVGDALATQALTSALDLMDEALGKRWSGNLPWLQRGVFLDAAQDLIDRIPLLRTYRAEELPALFDRLSRDGPPRRKALLGDRKSDVGDLTSNELLDARASLEETLVHHAHLDRDLRLVAVALAAMRDRAAAGAFPASGPAELAAPSLHDPITGDAFAWTTGPGEGQATLVAPAGRGEGAEALALP